MLMKAKFDHSADAGVKMGFKLPDGNKTEHTFSSCSTVKVCIHALPCHLHSLD